MNLLIIGAMEIEIKDLLSRFKNINKVEYGKFVFYLADLDKYHLIIAKSGIGKVMAGCLMGTALSKFKIDLVINIGVAGGCKDLQLGDVVIGKDCVFGDVDVSGFGYQKGELPGFPPAYPGALDLILKVPADIKLKTICTTDTFMTDIRQIKDLDMLYPGLDLCCFDMESAAFACCAFLYQIPFISIRSITDIIGKEMQINDYDAFLEKCALKSSDLLFSLLKKGFIAIDKEG